MSSKSKSSQLQTSSQQDNRIVADGGASAISGLSAGKNSTISISNTTTDSGLISAAFDYFKAKDVHAAEQSNRLASATADGFKSIITAGSGFLDKATAAADPQSQQSRLEMMMMGVAALAVLFMFMGHK